MNEEIFAAMAEQMRPDAKVLADLQTQLVAESTETTTPGVQSGRGKRPPTRWLAAAAAAAVVAALAAPALGSWSTQPADSTMEGDGSTVTAIDYAALYREVSAAAVNASQVTKSAYGDRAAAGIGGAQSEASSKAWQTNVQVQGIDEGDIVKSDGHQLYVASGKSVAIVAAEGEKTRELARIDTGEGAAGKPSGDAGTVQGPVVDLVLRGSTLVVFVTEYRPRLVDLPRGLPGTTDTTMVPLDAAATKALFYDISDPSAPRYLSSQGQSGGLVTTRLVEDLLYVVTEYTLADPDSLRPGDPKTFVPVLTTETTGEAIKAADCQIMPGASGPSYTVVSSIDLRSQARVDAVSVFGGTSSIYLSASNLYVAGPQYDPSATEPGESGGAKDVAQAAVTNLARISIEAGQLSIAAQGSVLGTVLNQFALDEYEGNLRVVTTVEGTDRGGSWLQRTALYVLSPKLKVLGSIPALVTGESLRSVRFAGSVGYVVTFKQVDPLFAIDLSRPENPKVLSALKIPGFSTYLHPWGVGQLLGLGSDVSRDGEQRGLKLTMFNTANPRAVTETKAVRIKGDDSAALTQHKAVLVDPSSGVIGLPVTTWAEGESRSVYAVYRYDPSAGFKLVKRLPVASQTGAEALSLRGLLIDGHLYVASARSVTSYRTDTYNSVAKVVLGG